MIEFLLFAAFSFMLLGSALMVIMGSHPVRSALFLVLCFFAATGLWLMLSAEFLALILILVYVGAVMTLFLFILMTISIDFEKLKSSRSYYYFPLGLLIAALFTALLIFALSALNISHPIADAEVSNVSNTLELGEVLYTQYAFAFEIAAVILLVAMIAAISLTLDGPVRRKAQNVVDQIKVRREDRVRLVKD